METRDTFTGKLYNALLGGRLGCIPTECNYHMATPFYRAIFPTGIKLAQKNPEELLKTIKQYGILHSVRNASLGRTESVSIAAFR